jgi:hypothetical protein
MAIEAHALLRQLAITVTVNNYDKLIAYEKRHNLKLPWEYWYSKI